MHALKPLLDALAARPGIDLSKLDPEALVAGLDDATVEALLADILVEEERARFNRFHDLFPDETHEIAGQLIHARHLYPRHLEFFEASAKYRQILFLAANRVGKTIAGGYAMSAHLTGRYPHWWMGKVFRRPIRAWAAGDTNETTRDIIQKELLGEVVWIGARKTVDGSGLIPRDTIGEITWKQGVQNLVDTVAVKHVSGRWSSLALKSYDQGRRAFQGTAKEVIWLDEEVPEDVANECMIRLATTKGILMLTFTPLKGMTPLVLSYVNPEVANGIQNG
ncbi:terminase family protein [Sphingomonas sp.]|uniref:terminase large subunit domain-containing protein n=1 Tax=Sphingomonas sp. TaxID=28214 RepID=UPI00307DBD2E